MDKSIRLIALPVYGGKMVTEVRYDLASGSDSAMTEENEKSALDEALLSVWRQALVERKKRVRLGEDSYPVQHTAKSKLAQVDFEFAGQPIRGLEQNPATASRWADLARKGAKVMQFLINGRYIAAISDGKITHFSPTK
jgi:hypothetical protein